MSPCAYLCLQKPNKVETPGTTGSVCSDGDDRKSGLTPQEGVVRGGCGILYLDERIEWGMCARIATRRAVRHHGRTTAACIPVGQAVVIDRRQVRPYKPVRGHVPRVDRPSATFRANPYHSRAFVDNAPGTVAARAICYAHDNAVHARLRGCSCPIASIASAA